MKVSIMTRLTVLTGGAGVNEPTMARRACRIRLSLRIQSADWASPDRR